MKKHVLFASLLTLGLVASGTLLFSSNETRATSASSVTTKYVSLGPGVINENTKEDPSMITTERYSLAFRGHAFMFFMNSDMYQGVPYHTPVSTNEMVDTNLDLVRIYSNETDYVTLKEYNDRAGNTIEYNLWEDACLNLGVLTSGLEAKDIYMVSIAEGFVYPYASSDHSTKYVQSETLTLINVSYGDRSVTDIFFSTGWFEKKTLNGGIKEIPIAAFSDQSGFGHYYAHIRGEAANGVSSGTDNDTCYLLIFFDQEKTYNEGYNNYTNVTIPSSYFDLSDSETSFINTLYKKVKFYTKKGETLTLFDVSNPFKKGLPIYNRYGERGCISFRLGNRELSSGEVFDDKYYDANEFSSLTIERGAQFPAYVTTNGDSKIDYRYTQIDTVKIDLFPSYNDWMTTASLNYTYGDANITSLGARDVVINGVSTPVIDIELDNNNFAGISDKEIEAYTVELTRYVYVNGRSIKYFNEGFDTKVFVNLDGKENTLSITANVNSSSDIKEIIVQKGTAIPAATESSKSIEIYGDIAFYNILRTTSYSRKSSSDPFTKDNSTTWTLWFEGQNPVRVKNASYFDIDELSFIPEKEKARFNYWVDETGLQASGNIQIYLGKEFFGNYTLLHDVTLKVDDKVVTVRVDHNTRLTSVDSVKKKLNPSKDGYTFLGWYDENDEYFNIDNKIIKDQNLTAVFEKDGVVTSGCGGSISATSFAILIPSIAGIVLLVKRKKEN